jgi:hypothetical protein
VSQKKIDRLLKRIEELTARIGVCLDDDLNGDLKEIMKQEDKGQYFIQSKSNLPLPINNYYIEGIRDKHPEGSFCVFSGIIRKRR